MRDLLVPFARLCSLLMRLSLWIAAIGLMVMTVLIGAQVFYRYVLSNPLVWSEQVSVLLMGWFIFLGSAVGVRENYHMGFEVLYYVLPAGARPWMATISDLAILGFGAGMVYYATWLAWAGWGSKIPVVHLPAGVTYLPVAASGVLIVLFVLERLALRAIGKEPAFGPQTGHAPANEV